MKKKMNCILWVFDQEPRNEVFGEGTGVTEEIFIKFVVDCRDVDQSLLFAVSKER